MSDHKPTGPYVYQPFGMQHPDHWAAGRIYAIGGLPYLAIVKGLTKPEAEVVRDALVRLVAREELTRVGQEMGEYDVNPGFEPGTR